MNFRLLVAHHRNNTVVALPFYGRDYFDQRPNIQKPIFNHVVSLAMANGLFYWTNGANVLTEGYHREQKKYFHNFYLDRYFYVLV